MCGAEKPSQLKMSRSRFAFLFDESSWGWYVVKELKNYKIGTRYNCQSVFFVNLFLVESKSESRAESKESISDDNSLAGAHNISNNLI